ncbi:hypothetical protein NKH77_09630 [Streptomyces sp. M19]
MVEVFTRLNGFVERRPGRLLLIVGVLILVGLGVGGSSSPR